MKTYVLFLATLNHHVWYHALFIVKFINDLAELCLNFSDIILGPIIPSGKYTFAPKTDEEIDYSELI
jgi:hypothetical protein